MAKKSITRKIMLLFLLPGVGTIIVLGFFYSFMQHTAHDADFINIAGRQRLLSQQILVDTHMVVKMGHADDREKLHGLIEHFDHALRALQYGGMVDQQFRLVAAPDSMQPHFAAIRTVWAELMPSLRLIAGDVVEGLEQETAYQTIRNRIGELTEASDRLVRAYQTRIERLRSEMFMLLLLSVVIGIGSLLSVIAIVRRYDQERHASEALLEKSRERFAMAAEGANDGIWDWDLEANRLYFSSRWKEMLGYGEDEIGNTFIAWRDLLHPEDLGRFLSSWADFMESGGERMQIEYRMQCKDGRYNWILCRGLVNRDEHNRPVRLSGSHTDISKRVQVLEQLRQERVQERRLLEKLQQAQDELLQSEERLRYSMLFANLGTLEWDIDTGSIDFSESIAPILGYEQGRRATTLDELISLIHSEERERVEQALNFCVEQGIQFDEEFRISQPDGDDRWLHLRGDIVREDQGHERQMLGMVQDITRRKQGELELSTSNTVLNQTIEQLFEAQEQVSQSETRLKSILDIAPEAIIVFDEKLRIVVFNKGAESIFGYGQSEIMGQSLELLLPEQFAADHHHHVERFLASSDASMMMRSRSEVAGRRKDGSEFPAGASVSKQEIGGQPMYTVIMRDLSEQRAVEAALHREKEEQAELIKQLQDTQAQLLQSEKMASIGQLAAGVAHEINNPVGYVTSNIGSLRNYLNDLFRLLHSYEQGESKITDQAALEAIQTIKQEVEIDYLKQDLNDLMDESEEGVSRVKKIVQDLKDFSHVDEEEWQWADLHRGIDSTLNIVHNELKYKAEVVKEYGELPQVECIIAQLNQVFMNMLVNAAHAIEERGTITVRTGTEGDGVWVEIEDDGKGMDAETQKRIFDPFYTTKPVGQGTGLGMSLSYTIIQKHSGVITVDSEPGRGTRFHIWLPIKQAERQAED